MTRWLCLVAAAAMLAGCGYDWRSRAGESPAEIAKDPAMGVSSQACHAAEDYILKDMHAPADSSFGKCDLASEDGVNWTVAIAINVPHTDEHGVRKPDTFYWVDAHVNPKTKAVEATGGIHN